MIKNLSFKFVLVFLVLAVGVFTVSTCYATPSASTSSIISDTPFTLNEVYNSDAYKNYVNNTNNFSERTIDDLDFLIFSGSLSTYDIYIYFNKYPDGAYFDRGSTSSRYYYIYDSNGNVLNQYASYILIKYDVSTGLFTTSATNGSWSKFSNVNLSNLTSFYLSDLTTLEFRAFSLAYVPSFTPDTSFDYSIVGVKRGQTKLSIENLDSTLKMYGYIDLEKTFEIGSILDVSANVDKLRLMTYDSETYCYLYDGEELAYYIVDEDNKILDTGYISEMSKGYFLYGFTVNNGVDFVFLKDGQVYWDNTLKFKYSLNNSGLQQDNTIVSMGSSSYIETNKTISSNIYTGYVYDSVGNLLSQAESSFFNDLSNISISVDTNYFETNVGWNKSCYWLLSFQLNGKSADGSYIDFSNYSVRWSIPTWLVVDSIEVGGQEYSNYNGIFNNISSNGYSGVVNLKIFELIKEHTSNFDIKLEVFDGNNNLVLTYLINSDDIVFNKVSSEENNVDKGDYDILDNPNYTGGSSSSSNINDIQNWTADDYVNLMNTDNFVWEFFKAILGNLPWWITTPLTILIFGVVIITIIRFARGA